MLELPAAPKDRGHIAELSFALEAKKRGFTVLTTGGDNAPFDVVLYKDNKFHRVQVKSCLKQEPKRTRWTFTVKFGGKHQSRAYRKHDVDFIALYAFDADWWYIIPTEVVAEAISIKIDSKGLFDIFKNNWTVFN